MMSLFLFFAPVSIVCGVVDVPLFPRRLLSPKKEEKKAMSVLAIVHTAHSTQHTSI